MAPHLKINTSDGSTLMNVFSDERFEDALFWKSACPQAIMSATGIIIEANDSMCELLGYANSELVRMSIVDITYNSDSARDIEMRAQCITSDRNEYTMERRYLSKKDKVIWVKSHIQAIRDSSDHVTHFMVTSMPLPNGGIYKVEKDEKTGEVVVKPLFSILQLLKDDWKTATALGIVIIFSIFDKLKDNFQMIIDLFK